MTECVVARAAVVRAALSVVKLITHDVVRVAQFTLLPQSLVLQRVFPSCKTSFSGQEADPVALVF